MKRFRLFLVMFALIVVFAAINGTVWADASEKININTATAEELVQLKKIGPKTAAKILEYREANGPFEKPADIILVKGIGEKIFEMNKDQIVVE